MKNHRDVRGSRPQSLGQLVSCSAGQFFPRHLKTPIKHLLGESSRLRVLLAGMVGCDEGDFFIQWIAHGMSELGKRPGDVPLKFLTSPPIGLPGNPPQSHYHTHMIEQLQFPSQILPAISQFLTCRLVQGRRTVDSGRDIGILKSQPILTVPAGGLCTKLEAVEGAVEKVSTPVSSKHSSGSVGSMPGGCQSPDQQAGRLIPSRGNRFAPLGPVPVRASFFTCKPFTMFDQARTDPAFDDLLLQLSEGLFQ